MSPLPNFRIVTDLMELERVATRLPPIVRSVNRVGCHPLVKVMATLGPACYDPRKIRAMIGEGADLFRVNLSHVQTPDDWRGVGQSILWTRWAAERLDRQVQIVADLKGPEFRIAGERGSSFSLKEGERVRMTTRPGFSHRAEGETPVVHLRIPTGYEGLLADMRRTTDLKKTPRLFIDDGDIAIELEGWPGVFDSKFPETDFWGVVRRGGLVRANKAVNLPDFQLAGLPEIVPADVADLEAAFSDQLFAGVRTAGDLPTHLPDELRRSPEWAGLWKVYGFDAVAISHVRGPGNVVAVRERLARLGAGHVWLQPKIETDEAGQEPILREILSVPGVRGVMHARGDHALAVGFENVPFYERLIARVSRELGIPMTLATGVLGSIASGQAHASRPEYAALWASLEAGVHAFMLSNETAEPIPGTTSAQVVQLLAEAAAAETMEPAIGRLSSRRLQQDEVLRIHSERARHALQTAESRGTQTETERVHLRHYRWNNALRAVMEDQQHAAIDAIVLWSETGGSMRAVAQALPRTPVYVVTPRIRVAREAAGLRGVYPILLNRRPKNGRELEAIVRAVLSPPSDAPRSLLVNLVHNLP